MKRTALLQDYYSYSLTLASSLGQNEPEVGRCFVVNTGHFDSLILLIRLRIEAEVKLKSTLRMRSYLAGWLM